MAFSHLQRASFYMRKTTKLLKAREKGVYSDVLLQIVLHTFEEHLRVITTILGFTKTVAGKNKIYCCSFNVESML